jgi:hypothetical protein
MDAPRLCLYKDYIIWGFFVGGAFAPMTLLALSTLGERDMANGSTLVNVARLVAGSMGTSYATASLSIKRDAFYEALSNHLTWGSAALSDLMGRLSPGGVAGMDTFDPETWARLLAQAKYLILLRASSFAFEAAYEHLALFSLAALVLVVLVRKSKRFSG